jgi:predicted nuclease of predicted toxin-antitoxin system
MSFSKFKFLLDENVHVELYRFLEREEVDVKVGEKGLKNGELAQLCLRERRIFVTNDQDFTNYSKDKILGVVWLRIPQNDLDNLLKSFSMLLRKCSKFEGNLIILEPEKFDIFQLAKER